MAPRSLLLLLLNLSLFLSVHSAEDVLVTVKGVTNIATTDENFVCVTLDWWPTNKCDYNMCPWGKAGLFNLDLKNPVLANAIKAFSPLRIRFGGSLQDQILYNVGDSIKNCPRMKKREDGLFGFSEGCLTMERWDEINQLVSKTGAMATFGLNALIGKKKVSEDGLYVGKWMSKNSHDLMKYTHFKGYKIESWELGNELCGSGVSARVDPAEYAKDTIALKKIINHVYKNSSSKPKVIAPGGFFDEKWFRTFLQATGPNVVDVVTHHLYDLGPGVDPNLINKMQDPFYLDKTAQTYKDVEALVKNYPWASPWVGESGGAYNSGGKLVSHSFVDSFWYVDSLGMTSTFNHKAFCRQTLIGGNYGLLNTTTFVPNPDYYSALLWHRLMGKQVLSISHTGSPYLRTYSHCSKSKGGITIVLINMSNSTSFRVRVKDDLNIYPMEISHGHEQRQEYHLTPKDGDIKSTVMLLNGSPLKLTKTLDIPSFPPLHVDPSSPIVVVPDSIVFAVLKGFQAPACAQD